MRQMEELKGQISEMEEQVKKAEEFNHSLRMKKEEVMQRLQVLQARLEAGQKESRQLLKEQAVNKEEQAEMYGARYKHNKTSIVLNQGCQSVKLTSVHRPHKTQLDVKWTSTIIT